jgi:hypothetical protein
VPMLRTRDVSSERSVLDLCHVWFGHYGTGACIRANASDSRPGRRHERRVELPTTVGPHPTAQFRRRFPLLFTAAARRLLPLGARRVIVCGDSTGTRGDAWLNPSLQTTRRSRRCI